MAAYILDVENVLTDPSSPMDPSFKQWFLNWQLTRENYIVTSGDLSAVQLYLGQDVVDGAKLVFTNDGAKTIEKGLDLTFDMPGEENESLDRRRIIKWIDTKPLILFAHSTKPGERNFPLAGFVELVHICDDWSHTWELLRMFS